MTNKEFMEALLSDAMEEPYTSKVEDIIRALDVYDDLLEACEAVMKATIEYEDVIPEELYPVIKKIEQAISKSRGE